MSISISAVDFLNAGAEEMSKPSRRRLEMASKSCCDYAMSIDITYWNDTMKNSMSRAKDELGAIFFRVFMSDKWQLDDKQVFKRLV